MKISPNNEKIQKYLIELADEYKELLFNALVERSESLDDVSISELLRLDNEIKRPLIANYHRQKRRRKMFLTCGLVYTFLGLFLMIMYYMIKSDLFHSTDGVVLLISILTFAVGVIISAFSFLLPFHKSDISKTKLSQTEDIKLLSFEVIAKWRELEGVVNDLAEDSSISMTRSIIDYLSSNNFTDKEENNILKDFLKIRNSIAHSVDITYSANEIKMTIGKVSTIIEKLRKIL